MPKDRLLQQVGQWGTFWELASCKVLQSKCCCPLHKGLIWPQQSKQQRHRTCRNYCIYTCAADGQVLGCTKRWLVSPVRLSCTMRLLRLHAQLEGLISIKQSVQAQRCCNGAVLFVLRAITSDIPQCACCSCTAGWWLP